MEFAEAFAIKRVEAAPAIRLEMWQDFQLSVDGSCYANVIRYDFIKRKGLVRKNALQLKVLAETHSLQRVC